MDYFHSAVLQKLKLSLEPIFDYDVFHDHDDTAIIRRPAFHLPEVWRLPAVRCRRWVLPKVPV
jgi:hypothetical protein